MPGEKKSSSSSSSEAVASPSPLSEILSSLASFFSRITLGQQVHDLMTTYLPAVTRFWSSVQRSPVFVSMKQRMMELLGSAASEASKKLEEHKGALDDARTIVDAAQKDITDKLTAMGSMAKGTGQKAISDFMENTTTGKAIGNFVENSETGKAIKRIVDRGPDGWRDGLRKTADAKE